MQVGNITASFIRPANTTAYATGQLVANSTVAGSVVPMKFGLFNSFPVAQYRLTRARLFKSSANIGNATFRLHLYQALTPGNGPVAQNGDGANWLTTGAASWLGNIDISSMLAFQDGAAGTGSPVSGSEHYIRTASGDFVFGFLMALGAYTPVSGEQFTVCLETLENY